MLTIASWRVGFKLQNLESFCQINWWYSTDTVSNKWCSYPHWWLKNGVNHWHLRSWNTIIATDLLSAMYHAVSKLAGAHQDASWGHHNLPNLIHIPWCSCKSWWLQFLARKTPCPLSSSECKRCVVTWDFQTAIVVPNYPIMTETIYVSSALRGPWRSFILFGRLEAIN